MTALVTSTPSRAALVLRRLNPALIVVLIVIVFAWQLSMTPSWSRLLVAAFLTLPLWAPLPGLLRGNRRTCAWATLCVIPSFILGITEAVANPETRGWSGACLGVALVLFAGLIGYLRVTK